MELRKSSKMKHDFEIYERANDGTRAHVPLANPISQRFAQP